MNNVNEYKVVEIDGETYEVHAITTYMNGIINETEPVLVKKVYGVRRVYRLKGSEIKEVHAFSHLDFGNGFAVTDEDGNLMVEVLTEIKD